MTEPAFEPIERPKPSGEIRAEVTERGVATIYLDSLAGSLTEEDVARLADGTVSRDALSRLVARMFSDGQWFDCERSDTEFDGFVDGGVTEAIFERLTDWAEKEIAHKPTPGQIRLDGADA